MRIEIVWDDDSAHHIIMRHNVYPYEVDEVIESHDYLVIKGRKRTYYIYGQTESGRYLFIVLTPKGRGLYRVLSARDMTKKDRRYYKRRGK